MINHDPINPNPNPEPEVNIRLAAACLSGLPVLEDKSLQRRQDAFDGVNGRSEGSPLPTCPMTAEELLFLEAEFVETTLKCDEAMKVYEEGTLTPDERDDLFDHIGMLLAGLNLSDIHEHPDVLKRAHETIRQRRESGSSGDPASDPIPSDASDPKGIE
jgi:hypothetical protein